MENPTTEKTYYVYGLKCPVSNEFRYVGQSTNPGQRFGQHLMQNTRTSNNSQRAEWIQGLLATGKMPELVILEEVYCDTPSKALVAENKWIKKLNKEGHDLTNVLRNRQGAAPIHSDVIDPEDYVTLAEATRLAGRTRQALLFRLKRGTLEGFKAWDKQQKINVWLVRAGQFSACTDEEEKERRKEAKRRKHLSCKLAKHLSEQWEKDVTPEEAIDFALVQAYSRLPGQDIFSAFAEPGHRNAYGEER